MSSKEKSAEMLKGLQKCSKYATHRNTPISIPTQTIVVIKKKQLPTSQKRKEDEEKSRLDKKKMDEVIQTRRTVGDSTEKRG